MTEKLLVDTVVTTLEAVFEEGSDKPVKWKGTFAQCDIKTSNNRRYSRGLWENVLSRPDVQDKLKGGMIGVLNHPANGETDLFRTAIATKKLTIESDGTITGEATIIPTIGGDILKKLIEAGIKVGVSSRGRGSVDEDGNVNEDYTLVAFDVVDNPAVPTAVPNVSESDKNKDKKPKNRRSGMSSYDKYYAIEANVRPTLQAIEGGNIDENMKEPIDAILKGALREAGEILEGEGNNLMSPIVNSLQERIIKCRSTLENFTKKVEEAETKPKKDVAENVDTKPKAVEVSLDTLKKSTDEKVDLDKKKKIEEMDIESLRIYATELEKIAEDVEAKYTESVASLEELKNQYAKAAVDEAIEKAVTDHPEWKEAKDFFEGATTIEDVEEMVTRLSKFAGTPEGDKKTTDDGKKLPKPGGDNKIDEKKPAKNKVVTEDDDDDESALPGVAENVAGQHMDLFLALDENAKQE